MAGNRRLLALVALSIAPATVAHAAPVQAQGDPSDGRLAAHVRFEPLQPEESRTEIADLGAYRGTVEVQARGGLSLYNELPLEDYVKGIVEMPAAWPAAALEAQAIAARSYGLHVQLGQGEICPDDRCQFYMGLFGQERDGGGRWAEAVDATAGQVLLAGGEPIRAEFSASNGGQSLAGGAPYLRPVDDPDDSHSPNHRWTYSVPLSEFAPFVDVPDGSTLVRLERDGDSIVSVLRPQEGEPTEQRRGAGDFASAVNATMDAPGGLPLPFPSDTFTLTTEGDRAVVDGGGWGHGRGMSQWGAYGKALRGFSAADIVAEYYNGISPVTLEDERASTRMRVNLGSGRGRVAVTLTRPSRVVADDGTVLAPLTIGRWQTVAERGGVRVLPPDDAGDLEVSGAQLLLGPQPGVSFRVSGSAIVKVRLRGPGVDHGPEPLVLLDGGDQTVALPVTKAPGDYVVLIEADGGPGRQSVAQLKYGVRPGAVFQASAAEPPPRRLPWVALALLLAVTASIGTVAAGRSTS